MTLDRVQGGDVGSVATATHLPRKLFAYSVTHDRSSGRGDRP